MVKKIFRYLVPVYIAWLLIHTFLFFSFMFSIAKGKEIDFSSFGLVIISHFLVTILGLAFMIYMIVDCSFRKFDKDYQKVMWILVIIFLICLEFY